MLSGITRRWDGKALARGAFDRTILSQRDRSVSTFNVYSNKTERSDSLLGRTPQTQGQTPKIFTSNARHANRRTLHVVFKRQTTYANMLKPMLDRHCRALVENLPLSNQRRRLRTGTAGCSLTYAPPPISETGERGRTGCPNCQRPRSCSFRSPHRVVPASWSSIRCRMSGHPTYQVSCCQ